MLEHSELSPFVKKRALAIFQRIAIAEGKIHGMPPEDVTFHEVGALDSIADIVLTCVGIEALGVEKVVVSALNDGRGTIECAHGTFPLPAPATMEILHGIPLGQIDEPHELITPTGAAIVAEFGESFGLMPRISSEKIGYGVGTRQLASRPNVLRAVLGTLVTISSIGAGAVGATLIVMLYPRMSSAEVAGTDIAYAVPLTAIAAFGHWWLGSIDWTLLGTLLLGSYAAGLAIPFLLAAWAFEWWIARSRTIARWLRPLEMVTGVLLVLMGALLLSGRFRLLTGFLAGLGQLVTLRA